MMLVEAARPKSSSAPPRCPEPRSVHKGYADIGTLRMDYELHGEARPGRAPLLLIHGSGSTIESNFGELIPLLTGTRQVIGVEEQGHGHTEGTGRPFTFEHSADDIATALEQLDIPHADVLGFSTGGIVSMRLAARHPSVVRHLVVASAFTRRDGLVNGFWDGLRNATLDLYPRRHRSTTGFTDIRTRIPPLRGCRPLD